MKSLFDKIIARAMQTPYHKGHLRHADGSLYMGRYALFESKYLSARVHHIATEDHDDVPHDHPWNFISIVLRGGYVERLGLLDEAAIARREGSIAHRKAKDAHRITYVAPDTWTLFIYGRFQHDWGFYTPEGWVQWRTFLDSGKSTMSKENNSERKTA